MFSLEVDEEIQLVVETVRQLASEEILPRMRESEAARQVDSALREAFDEIGLATLELPVELDGAGMGCLARVLVNEELAAADAGAALALDRYGPALSALIEMGGDEAVRALLDAVGDGRALLVVEGDAQIEVANETLDLDAPWVPVDDPAVVVVLHGDEALLVKDGIETETVRGAGLRAAGASGLRIRKGAVVGRWASEEGAIRARARARLYNASLLLGVMRAACEFSANYSQERQAFGKPIGHHQALAYMIVDMQMALEAARLLVHEAAWRIDRGLPCAAEAASAFAECIEVSRSIGPNGVQILGGHGFMADYPVEKHMREARALGLCCGGYDAAIQEAGDIICATPHPLGLGAKGAL